MKKILMIITSCFLGIIMAVLYSSCSRNPQEIDVTHPPREKKYIYDYANIFEDVADYSDDYLEKNIKEIYSIHPVIVSVPSLGKEQTIEEMAVEIMDNWQIGKETGGRGILLLLSDSEKQVKLEVSYELEDVFTDMFCGYIENIQLKPRFFSNNLGEGLLAVMEEIERRAQIKQQGEYTKDSILELDRKLISGGAGAKRELTKFQKEKVEISSDKYPAGKTPQEAWERMKQSWRDKERDYNLGIYTEICKLLYRDYTNTPDSRFEENVRTWGNKKYEVIQNGDYAMISFGNKDGWDNSPFLLCRNKDGWKFDLVHQRKYVRMGPAPSWGIEWANHPYRDMLSGASHWMGQDIPLEGEDIYRPENDETLARKIKDLEIKYKNNPEDFETALELGKLYTITSMAPKQFSVLKRAKQLNPDNSFTYKYLAISDVDAYYQYEAAVSEMKEYIKREPHHAFGYNFLGYLYYCLKNYDEAVRMLEKAVEIRKDNCYAYCLLARSYAELYFKAQALDPRKVNYRSSAIEMLDRAENTESPDEGRIGWLKSWLVKKELLVGETE